MAATYHLALRADDGRTFYRGELNGRPTGLTPDVQHAFIFSRAGALHAAELANAAFPGLPAPIARAVQLTSTGKVRNVRS